MGGVLPGRAIARRLQHCRSEQAERVPKVLISVGRRDVPSVNPIYERIGILWDGRYKSLR
jgi:hypothetical protein